MRCDENEGNGPENRHKKQKKKLYEKRGFFYVEQNTMMETVFLV